MVKEIINSVHYFLRLAPISNYTYLPVASGDFSTRGCCPKIILHFLKFYFIFAFILQISSNTASFSLFFKFKFRFFLNIFWDFRPKRILLCVSEGRSQKLFLWLKLSQSLNWKSTLFHNEPACPIRKSSISPNSIAISKLWLVYSTLSYFRSYTLRILRNGLVHLYLFLFCIVNILIVPQREQFLFD